MATTTKDVNPEPVRAGSSAPASTSGAGADAPVSSSLEALRQRRDALQKEIQEENERQQLEREIDALEKQVEPIRRRREQRETRTF